MNFKKLFRRGLLAFILFVGMLFCVTAIQAQNAEQITVKGMVVDTTGSPLIGVTVVVVESSKGVITDYNGNFSIESKKGNTLRFSYLGYKNQEIAASTDFINVRMSEDKINLEEVVVVSIGYGTSRKSDLTGAISSVSSEKLNKGIITTSEQLLQGKIAGVTVIKGSGDPSAGAKIRLRGGTSLNGGNDPLYVVDGIPGADINSISPNDISSIDVLKDASAAAIYGSRGANGVIIVTTKKAKEGRSYTEYNGYTAIGKVSKKYDLMTADDFRQWAKDNPTLSGSFLDNGANSNWQDALLQTSYTQSHSISFDGNSGKSSYRASLNYLDNPGTIKNSGLTRIGGSLNLKHKTLNDKLTFDVGLNNTFDSWDAINGGILLSAYYLNPTDSIYTADGKYYSFTGTDRNPVAVNNETTDKQTRQRLLSYAKTELEIISGLKAVLNLSYSLDDYNQNRYLTRLEPYEGAAYGGSATKANAKSTNSISEFYLNYDYKTGDHSFNAMGGYSYGYSQYYNFVSRARNFTTDGSLDNDLVSGKDMWSGQVGSGKGESKLISFYGRLNYNYLSRYMITATLRRDGSSKFGANHKWGLFPSVSAAWRISDESFLKGSSWLDNLKIRVGYGVTGNQEAIDPGLSLASLGAVSNGSYWDPTTNTWKSSWGPSRNVNPNLKWEETAQTNIGIDFGFLNRFSGTAEYYVKNTTDLLFKYPVPVPPYLVNSIIANVGTLSNKGFEFSLNTIILNGRFKWNVDLNFAYNEQKIDKLTNKDFYTPAITKGDLNGLPGQSGKFSQLIKEGYVAGTWFGPKVDSIGTAGVNKGRFFYHDTTGKAVTNPALVKSEILGDVQPDYSAGFGMNFAYANFDLSFAFNGVFGQKVLNCSNFYIKNRAGFPKYNITKETLNSAVTQAPVFNDYYLEDGSFLRFQSLIFGYTIPLKTNKWITKARVYVSGENLAVFTKYSGLDPEVSLDGLDSPGMDRNSYPKSRVFSFGISLGF